MISAQHDKFVFYAKNLECKSLFDKKAKKERYFVKGHIDSEDLDLVNDIVTKECMKDISQQLKSRTIKLDLDHETLRKGKGETDFDAKLNLTKLPLGKATSETLDQKGNHVEFELNPNWKKLNAKGDVIIPFSEVWDNLKGGFYDAFSIAYVPLKTAFRQVKDVKARLLDRVNLINVALTGNPINPGATMTSVMAKSLEWLKSKEEKGYDKDGAHAHTEEAPLGEHNHPEIENVVRSEVDYLSDRISNLSDRLFKIENGTSDNKEDTMLKNKQKKAGDKKMSDENKNDKPDGEGKPQDQKPDTPPTDSKPDAEGSNTGSEGGEEGGNAPSGDGAEGKSIGVKAFADLKGQVSKLSESLDKINKVLEKALPSGYGAADKSLRAGKPKMDTKSTATGALDLI